MRFTVLFENEQGAVAEVIFVPAGYTIGLCTYHAEHGGLEWFLLDRGTGAYELRVRYTGREEVTGRVLVRFDGFDLEKGYTLLPGAYYNGNYHEYLKTATFLHMPDHPRFRISLAGAASPHVINWDGGTRGRSIYFSPTSCAGPNGVHLDAVDKSVTFTMPAGDDDCNEDAVIERAPYVWHHRDVLSCAFTLRDFTATKPADVFAHYMNECRDTEYLPAENAFRAPADETAALVREWIVKKHYIETADGKPILKNAFTDLDRDGVCEEISEWNIMIGWCSGPMTALPLLAAGGCARECALKYLDFITGEGFSPSGIKMPIFDGREWIDPRAEFCPAEGCQYQHVRFYADYIYYLGRAISYEASRGVSHPAWERDFAREVDILLGIWDENHDFGMYWDIMHEKVRVIRFGTGASAFALLALIEAYQHGIQPERVKKCLNEAIEVYYARCVASGRCNAGPNDVREADDSESIAAMTDAFTQQYELFGDRHMLDMAVEACNIFATWVVAYVPEFPGGTPLHGINVCGGVIANTQNRHIGPGICTNSGRFLRKLAEFTGDARYEKMYLQIKQAAYNCVCRYDGEVMSQDFKEAFRKGMVTEQINIYDYFSKPGYPWCVSASWPATFVLLSEFDDKIDGFGR